MSSRVDRVLLVDVITHPFDNLSVLQLMDL